MNRVLFLVSLFLCLGCPKKKEEPVASSPPPSQNRPSKKHDAGKDVPPVVDSGGGVAPVQDSGGIHIIADAGSRATSADAGGAQTPIADAGGSRTPSADAGGTQTSIVDAGRSPRPWVIPEGLNGSIPSERKALPAFSRVKDHNGALVSPDALLGHWTVLWFYPRASTAG